jgi:hypothetical protein
MADLSRRKFLQVSLGTTAVAGIFAGSAATLLSGCKSGGGGGSKALSCTDTSSLAPMDAQLRTALGYIDATPNPSQKCLTCIQYVPAAPDACGTCKLVKGPINPEGYCKSWAAKPA